MGKSVIVLLLFLSGCFLLSGIEKGLLYDLDFSREEKITLHKNAQIRHRKLHLSGKGDYISLQGSSGRHLTRKGLTLIVTAKLKEKGTAQGALHKARDMFVSKGSEYIFSRNDNVLYFNFFDGKKWAAQVMGSAPLPGEWAQYAVTVEPFDDRAQGDQGYWISFYINGEREQISKVSHAEPKAVDAPILIGKGFGGGPWYLNGEVAAVKIYERALNPAEMAHVFSKEKRVNPIRKGFFPLQKTLAEELALLSGKDSSAEIRFLTQALKRGAATGLDQQKVLATLRSLKSFRKETDFSVIQKKLHSSKGDFRLILTGKTASLAAVGTGKGAHPLLGVYSLEHRREIFGERTLSWQIHWFEKRDKKTLESNADSLQWESTVQDNNILQIHWKDPVEQLTASSTIRFENSRISSTFELNNLHPGRILDEVVYPRYTFAKLPGKDDRLVHPYLYGIQVKNPTLERFFLGQSGLYPSAKVSMQFGAYCDQNSGIYFALEDPLGRVKNYAVTGKRNQLYVQWGHFVPFRAGDKGRNSFSLNGNAVIQLYGKGSWYESGKIYRDFLKKKARWWVRDLPRKSTPEWMRNNTLWILCSTKTEGIAVDVYKTAAYLREYFQLPFGIHWYGWYDYNKAAWPHFPTKEFTARINEKIRKCGIYTIPYIDSRLWKINDGPGNTDYMYRSHGLKYAVRGRFNQLHNERYSQKYVYSIMCPGAVLWQDFLTKLVKRIAGEQFDGVYHDQVCSSQPVLCFAAGHNHLLNDPAVWVEKGYKVIFDKIRAATAKQYPAFCHTTEECAEPYMNFMDGYLVWRSTDEGQIPLFQSIYSGRIQFVGRAFNHVRSGHKQSFFSKTGQQLVNGEQIGWFNLGEMRQPDQRRLYVKKAMHLRLALLPYFNQGRMEEPVSFRDMPMEKVLWGGMEPQKVTMPKIAASSWRGPEGNRIFFFTNTQRNSCVKATVQISPEGKGIWICREGAAKPLFMRKAPGELTLNPLTSEIWVCGPEKEAVRLQKTLQKIASFDCGKSLRFLADFQVKKHKGVPGKAFMPGDAAGFSGCAKAQDNSYFGWFEDGCVISYGEVDFGKDAAKTFILKVSVFPRYEGGTVEIRSQGKDGKERSAGFLKLTSTGGWDHYKEIPLTLKEPLSGKQKITLLVNGRAACNFVSWKYGTK